MGIYSIIICHGEGTVGELTTGSLFQRGKESWFLAISVERKTPRASRPMETCFKYRFALSSSRLTAEDTRSTSWSRWLYDVKEAVFCLLCNVCKDIGCAICAMIQKTSVAFTVRRYRRCWLRTLLRIVATLGTINRICISLCPYVA